jgi:hypothetical protein
VGQVVSSWVLVTEAVGRPACKVRTHAPSGRRGARARCVDVACCKCKAGEAVFKRLWRAAATRSNTNQPGEACVPARQGSLRDKRALPRLSIHGAATALPATRAHHTLPRIKGSHTADSAATRTLPQSPAFHHPGCRDTDVESLHATRPRATPTAAHPLGATMMAPRPSMAICCVILGEQPGERRAAGATGDPPPPRTRPAAAAANPPPISRLLRRTTVSAVLHRGLILSSCCVFARCTGLALLHLAAAQDLTTQGEVACALLRLGSPTAFT